MIHYLSLMRLHSLLNLVKYLLVQELREVNCFLNKEKSRSWISQETLTSRCCNIVPSHIFCVRFVFLRHVCSQSDVCLYVSAFCVELVQRLSRNLLSSDEAYHQHKHWICLAAQSLKSWALHFTILTVGDLMKTENWDHLCSMLMFFFQCLLDFLPQAVFSASLNCLHYCKYHLVHLF